MNPTQETIIFNVTTMSGESYRQYKGSLHYMCDQLLDMNQVPQGVWHLGSVAGNDQLPGQLEVVFDKTSISVLEIEQFLTGHGLDVTPA